MTNRYKHHNPITSRLLWIGGLGILLVSLVLQTNYLVRAESSQQQVKMRNRFSASYVYPVKDKCKQGYMVKPPNLPPLYVATATVPVSEKDIKDIVAQALLDRPPCDCKCTCSTTPPPVCTETTSYIPKCPCPVPTASTTSTCFTDHYFPQDVQDILRALHITACVPPQIPPCDCPRYRTCD